MPSIFISYRREDCPGHAGRIFDRLRARFGHDVVFMDVATIEAGVDFVEVIQGAVGSCDALLAVIGPEWLAASQAGRRRLDDPNDFVRLEIASALSRNVRVLPVLVDRAAMPTADALPADLQGLTRRQAVDLRDARWDDDVDQLIEGLERALGGKTPAPGPSTTDAPTHGTPARHSPRRALITASITIVALAILVTLGILFGPGMFSKPSSGTEASNTPPSAGPAPTPPQPAAEPVSAPKAPGQDPSPGGGQSPVAQPAAAAPVPSMPDVVGKSALEARELIRRAGMLGRIRYVENRTKPPETVLSQVLGRVEPGETQTVLLTVVAKSAVVVHFSAGDQKMADDLVDYLRTVRSTGGSVVRRQQVIVRVELAGRVSYSEASLATQAEGIAKDATLYLSKAYNRREALEPAERPRVARGTIIVGISPVAGVR